MTTTAKPETQLGLFEVPDAPRALLPAEKIWPADAAWTAWRGAHRPCDVCGRLVLQLGVQGAPAVQPARWRRKGPNSDLFVCNGHAIELRPHDEAVTARLKQLREQPAKPAPRRARGQRQYGS